MPKGWGSFSSSVAAATRSNGNGNGRQAPPGTPVLTPTGDQVLPDKAREQRSRYDTVLLAAGTTLPPEIEFFQVPQGRPGSGYALKTLAHTNMTLGNQLERGVAIDVHNVRIAIYAVGTARLGNQTMTRMAAIWEDSRLLFKVNNTEELDADPMEFTSGSGLTGLAQMNAPAPRTFIAPSPTVRYIRALARDILVPARTMFGVKLEINQNNTFLVNEAIGVGQDLAIRVSLYGMLSRPIE